MSNQAVGDNLNLKIHIAESLPNFAEFTVVEAATPQQQLITIYIEHLDEFHYVSTKHLVPNVCPLKRDTQEVPADAPETAKQQCTFDFSLHNNLGCDNTNDKSKQSVDQFRQKRAKYMRACSTKKLVIKEHTKQRRLLNLKKRLVSLQALS